MRGKSHPIRILIEASAGPEDARQKSRWSQALKFAHGWLLPPTRLKWFFKVNGGLPAALENTPSTGKQRDGKMMPARII
jgi:hypothetical protein